MYPNKQKAMGVRMRRQTDPVCGLEVEESYKVKTQKVILPVQGMPCASCDNRIKAILRQVPGVVAVNINFATEKAAVEYTLDQVTIKDLAKAIEAAGYKILQQ